MGALRAAELHPYGMVGNGSVFEMCRYGVIDADDEVAVMHDEAPEYHRMSDSLVVFRHAVAGARSKPCALRIRESREAFARVRAFVAARPERADVKAADALDTLTRFAELTSGETPLLQTRAPVGDTDVLRYHQLYGDDFPDRWRRFVVTQIGATAADGTYDTDTPA
jgi:hypothetical protein